MRHHAGGFMVKLLDYIGYISRAIETSIKGGSMPLSSYTIMHTDARLTSNDTATINNWVRETKDSISAKN